MLYDPKLWDQILEQLPELSVQERGFSKTEGYLAGVHFSLHLATAETTENFLILTGVPDKEEDLGTLKTFVALLSKVFLPSTIHLAYKRGRSIVVLWGILPDLLEKKLQGTLDRNHDAQRIEM